MTDESRRANAKLHAGKAPAAGKRIIENEKAGLKGPKAAPLSAEAEETLNAIRAGQIDALVIPDAGSHKIYALRSFAEINQAKAELRNAGTERKRTNAQLQALVRERERLFQDLHDGCIQSIYAVDLALEAAMRLSDTQPGKVGAMLGDSIASLNLVIQELRSFMTGHQRQMGAGQNLRSEIETVEQR
jgi:signal transduction histidine kinase